jgi:hypothetical protein
MGGIAVAIQPDLRLYGRDGHLVLIVDVRARYGTTPEWAAKLRQNLFETGEFPAAEFFLVATPEHMYLWKGVGKDPSLISPTHVFDARSVLKPYSESAGLDEPPVHKEVFDMVINFWLSELASWRELSAEDEQSWVKDSGLLAAIKNGRIELPDAA